jgi:hypothetical protein
MSLAGKGVIAIWQDLLPEARQDYYEWHNRQHVPERLSIPGFRRARRFIAVSGGPEFYTLYEADTPEDVSGKAYLERLNSPTEWTRRIMPAFRNMARSVCRVAYTEGVGEGGFMLTQRFGFPPGKQSALARDLCHRLLPPLSALPGIAGVHCCLADTSASRAATFEKTFRAAVDLTPPCVVMIEGTSCAYVRTAGEILAAELAPALEGQSIDTAVYQLEHAYANFVSGGNGTCPKL